MSRAKAPRAKGKSKAPAAEGAEPATEGPAPADGGPAAGDLAAARRALYLRRYVTGCTCAIADPLAFAPSADRGGILTLAKKYLEGRCHQRLVVDRVVEVRRHGLPIADGESMTGQFVVDIPEVVVEAWTPKPGDLVLGRIHSRTERDTFFRGAAPTPFLAQVVEPSEFGADRPSPRSLESCPDGSLLPLQILGAQMPPRHREGATGVVVLWGREAARTIQVRGGLSAEGAAALVDMAKALKGGKFGGPPAGEASDVESRLAKTFGLAPEAAGAADVADIVIKAASKSAVDLGGQWDYAPRATAAHPHRPAMSPGIQTVDAYSFCEFAIRRALGYRLAIAQLAEEYPTATKLGQVAAVWRAMERT